ncbi:MAG: carboxypeptidase-like regulatory domain-containing protein, partial [Bacteroidetes bacterium]|nr:carboxypeptidase-like regulatory domain-containing protein [Bacteroidota bacterium]
MKNFKNLLFVVFLLTATSIFAQTIEGVVQDETGPLPGATVQEKGTKNGVTTDFDGKFSLKLNNPKGAIVVSFIGMEKKEVSYDISATDVYAVGNIILVVDQNVLDEIVITQVSFAIDRKTPVAVSTVKAEIIEHKLGSQEFPEILKSTPGVYATKSGGGFGDGKLTMRGFNSENVAVMINGVPVNDMENGRVYWSNWA